MRASRPILLAVLGLLCASALCAEVRVVVGKNGKKIIYNVGVQGRSKGTDLTWLARQRNRVSKFDDIIYRYSDRLEIDPILVKAIIQVESGYDPMTVSHKGARGLMQLMPGTAKRFNVTKVHDPEQNIRGGTEYLAVLLKMFPHDLSRVIAAYNAGENAVLRYGGIPPYQETQTYVRKALTVYHGRPYGTMSISGLVAGKKLAGGAMRTARASGPRPIARSAGNAGGPTRFDAQMLSAR